MKPFLTSYGRIERKNSTTLVVTENDTGLYISFNAIGIVILSIAMLSLVRLSFFKISDLEITRSQLAQSILHASSASYYWSFGFISLLIILLALKLLIWGHENRQKYLKYLSGLLFFISAFLIVSLSNTAILSKGLFALISKFPVMFLYSILILVLLFFVYVGISFWKAPYPYYRERVTIFSLDENTLIQKIIRYPIPLVIYRNGKLNYGSSWVKAKYEYPLSDVISIHKYTSEKSDEFTYFVMLLFSKTNTYFPTIESRTVKENNQVLDIICKFLSLPKGEDLNNKNLIFSNNLVNMMLGRILEPNLVNRQSSRILGSHNQKISVSATMMMEENQRRLALNPNDPEACLMLGLAFMGINQFEAAIKKLQRSKILYEELGEQRQSVKVTDYLYRLQDYMMSNSINN